MDGDIVVYLLYVVLVCEVGVDGFVFMVIGRFFVFFDGLLMII